MSKKARFHLYIPEWVVVLLVTLLGAVARFSFIAKSSIWHDEGFSIALATRTPVEIWAGSARDVHPPLYYLLLHFWMSLFGTSQLAVRSLSAVAGIAVIPLGYIIVKKMAGKRAAVLAGFMLALAPFLIRYSQEARMYGLLGLIMLAAFYAVMCIVENPKKIWPYILYALAIAVGMYTHYFAALAVVSFWAYLVVLQSPKRWRFEKTIFLSAKWWLANIFALLIFLPWAPNALAQIGRAQGLGWLPKASLRTFHDTVWQFFTFTDARQIVSALYWLVPVLILALAVYLLVTDRSREKYMRLLVSYSFLPVAVALLVSLQRPIFHERYFAFSAIGIYIIVAIAVSRLAGKRSWLFVVMSLLVLSTELVGVRNVYSQANHQMGPVVQTVNNNYLPNDSIIAGELYVYFDASYYNKTGQKILLYTANSNLNGYGESGLLYDRSVYVASYDKFNSGDRVWLIGKTGQQNYYQQVPQSWLLLQEFSAGYGEARLYQVK